MKAPFARIASLLITAWFVSAVSTAAAADAEVHWQNYVGFSTHAVSLNAGDTLTVFNDDTNGSSIVISSDLDPANVDYFYFDLPNGTSKSHAYLTAGTFTFASEHSEDGLVTVTVGGGGSTVGPILLATPRMTDGQFLFDATGLTPGLATVLFTSTNLTDWVAIQTNLAIGASATFTNSAALPNCTYRLLELP